MRCHKAMDYISQEMDEHLPPDVTVDLTRHLDSCSECRDYRRDLLLASRAIGATAPELPENFEWKLQLKLNQTLQQAAGETFYPWDEADHDKWRWFRNFGAAAAVGMAAVLALAMFLGPVGETGDRGSASDRNGMIATVGTESSNAGSSDRLPLGSRQQFRGGLYNSGIQRPVSLGGMSVTGDGLFDRGWSGHNVEDLQTIQKLRSLNSQLNQQLFLQQRIIQGMEAHLDTLGASALDLEQE